MAHDDEREQGYDNGRATPHGIIVMAAFAAVLTSVTWVGSAIALQVAGIVRIPFLMCSAIYLVVSSGVDKITKWTAERIGY